MEIYAYNDHGNMLILSYRIIEEFVYACEKCKRWLPDYRIKHI